MHRLFGSPLASQPIPKWACVRRCNSTAGEARAGKSSQKYRALLNFHVACGEWQAAMLVFRRALAEDNSSTKLTTSRNLVTPLIELCVQKGKWSQAIEVFNEAIQVGADPSEALTPTLIAMKADEERNRAAEASKLLMLARSSVSESHSVFRVNLSELSLAKEFDQLVSQQALSLESALSALRRLVTSSALRQEVYPDTVIKLCQYFLRDAFPASTQLGSLSQTETAVTDQPRERSDLSSLMHSGVDAVSPSSSSRSSTDGQNMCLLKFMNAQFSPIDDIFHKAIAAKASMREVIPLRRNFAWDARHPNVPVDAGFVPHHSLSGFSLNEQFGIFSIGGDRFVSGASLKALHIDIQRAFCNRPLLVPDALSVVQNIHQIVAHSQRSDIVLFPSVLIQLVELAEKSHKARDHLKLLLTPGSQVVMLSFLEELSCTIGCWTETTSLSNEVVGGAVSRPQPALLEPAIQQQLQQSPDGLASLQLASLVRFVADSTSCTPHPAHLTLMSKNSLLRKLCQKFGIPIATPFR
jgi:hypothetical protein